MHTLNIAHLEPDVDEWLRQQAAKHGVSVEEEALALLRAAREQAKTAAERREDQKSRWEAIFAKAIVLPPGSPTSTDLIREDRDSR